MSQYRDDYNYDREAPAPRRAPADRPRSSGGRSTGGNVRGGSGSSRGGSGGGRRPSAPKRRSGGGFALPRGMGIAAAAMAALLVIAFLFKAACENLGMSEYIISKVAPLMAGQALPFVVFLVSTLMTFALANAWGVSAIMVPFVIPLAQAIDANLAVAIAAIFSGSVCGTQLCFYSDNSILIGQATGIQPLDHVKTQMPFALCAAALTSITYLVYGFLFLG